MRNIRASPVAIAFGEGPHPTTRCMTEYASAYTSELPTPQSRNAVAPLVDAEYAKYIELNSSPVLDQSPSTPTCATPVSGTPSDNTLLELHCPAPTISKPATISVEVKQSTALLKKYLAAESQV